MDEAEVKKLFGMTREEIKVFVGKYAEFLNRLTAAEKSLLTGSTPTVKMALKSFDPKDEVTEDDLNSLFQEEHRIRCPPILCCVPPDPVGGGI